jgi:hypothetical protein
MARHNNESKREDFGSVLTVHNLYIVNDRSETTFGTTRGISYVGLAIVNNQLLRNVTDWTCGIEESCSDHKILTFNLGMVRQDKPINNTDYVGIRYVINNEDFGKSEAILASNMMTKFDCENNKEILEKIDQEFFDKINSHEDVDELVDTAFFASLQRVIKHSKY